MAASISQKNCRLEIGEKRKRDCFVASLLIGLLAMTTVLIGCSQKPYHKESRFLMWTLIEITCQDKRAASAAFDEIKRIEKIANKFDPLAEVSQLNTKGQIKASKDLINLVKESIRIYNLSNGAFDITINPLADLWKNKIKKARNPQKEVTLPSPREIEDKLALVGSDKILIDENNSVIRFTQPGVTIDLGGIAKGYAVDMAVKRLKEFGVNSALINAGGNIYCLGKKNNRPWHIGIQHPRNPDKIYFYLDLENQAVATSGDYQQFFVSKGRRYSHIIDPRNGYPVENKILSATIIANNATIADGLSTTVFVLGKEKGVELLKKMRDNIDFRIIEQAQKGPGPFLKGEDGENNS